MGCEKSDEKELPTRHRSLMPEMAAFLVQHTHGKGHVRIRKLLITGCWKKVLVRH